MKKYLFSNSFMPALSCLLISTVSSLANIPGGGTGTGPNVTVTDNGDGTVTMANGTISLHIVKNGASINQIYYTYNNGSGTQTQQMLAGGKNGGEFYWEFGGWGGNPWVYSLVTNNGSYAEVDLYSDSASNGLVDVHFSMLRGSPGFYATPIYSHRPQDGAFGTGEERDNIYFAPYFNWMSVNDQVQRETGLNATYSPAFYSPQENSLVTSGVLQGTYDDKYKWSADFGVERVWGWSSVSDPAIGFTGQNLGIWHVVASSEFYNGGPLKPELNDAPMVNMINGGHYYFGNDSGFAAGETWTRVSGPYFIYFNNVSNTMTDPVQTSQALWTDAKAQAAAEATAWPYNWFNNANYAPASQRGVVTGQIVINDTFNPNASASNLWVGVVQQPAVTINNVYDFQLWEKPYQFWTRSDASGNFVISNVIAGNNYTLYAFGPGAEGMFMSKNQNGGNPGIIYSLPASQFTVVVTGGATNSLGPVTWTPARVGPTVFEIGYPDRKGDKFRHGDDYWVGDVGPSPTVPSPVWTKFLEFPFDFPNGLNYVVGSNRWNTDWNFVQSVYPDFSGNNAVSSSTVTFNLASNPSGATASILMGIASDDDSPVYVTVNGTLLVNGNATGAPTASLPGSGWFPSQTSSDSNIREENHGGYSDERLTFSGGLLNQGNNTINFSFRQAGGSGFTHHFMYDYIRLELTGYVPPAPAGVTAYAGNNAVLLSWPVTPGATGYNIYRTGPDGGFYDLTNGVVGPVSGSGPANATFVDTTAVNGTTYYYSVQSVNTAGNSSNSLPSGAVTPSPAISTAMPAAPGGLVVTGTSNAVTLSWNAVPGANFYTVQRGTVVNKLGYVPYYFVLSNTDTNTTITDHSGTLGCTYSYFVTATSAAGTGAPSASVSAKPVPPPPAAPPANVRLTTTVTSTNQANYITWSPVTGAVGYIVYRANSPSGPYNFPGNYLQVVATTNYNDGNLALNTLYSYVVVAMNAGGASANSAVASTAPAAPASLNAYPGNTQISLSWSASLGATSYILKRGTTGGNETTTLTNTTSTSYLDTGLVNGNTYYYIVFATSTGGSSPSSPEASATPFAGVPSVYWIDSITTAAQSWDASSNWSGGTTFPNGLQGSAIVNAPIGAAQTVNLDVPISLGTLSMGASGGAFNIVANGGSLNFDNSPGQASITELAASRGDAISAPVSINGGLTLSNLTANTFTLAGPVTGSAASITVNGSAAFNGTNTYSGGTYINSGAYLRLNLNETNNNTGIGTGPVTFMGGTLQLNGYAGNNGVYWGALSNNLVVPLGQTGTLLCPARIAGPGLGGTLTGGGTLNITVDYVRGMLNGDWSGFTGQIIASPRSGTGDFRINNAFGYANAAIYLNSGVTCYNMNVSGQTTDIGELDGVSGALVGTGNGAQTNPTWRIGAKNTTSTYGGTIGNSGVTSVIKIGAGNLILTGNNTYSGSTTINGGMLLANNPTGSATGTGSVLVASGGALGGTGTVSGTVTVNSGGTLSPGNPLGTLTINNNLNLLGGSTTQVQVQHAPPANDAVTVNGTLTQAGTLVVNQLDANAFTAGDTYQLLNATSFAGTFTNFVLPTLTGNLAWNTHAFQNTGTLSVVALNSPTIGGIRLSGGNLVISGGGGASQWPFLLLSTTNLSMPAWIVVATNQFDASGNFILTNAISPGSPQTFYKLELQ